MGCFPQPDPNGGLIYTITYGYHITTLSTKSWEPSPSSQFSLSHGFPQLGTPGFNEVRNCCASSPWCRKNSTVSCRCWISSKSYKGAQTQCLKRPWSRVLTMSNLNMSSTGLLMVDDSDHPNFFWGGTQIKTRFGSESCHKRTPSFLLGKPCWRKKWRRPIFRQFR